jgi:hypothetical protein
VNSDTFKRLEIVNGGLVVLVALIGFAAFSFKVGVGLTAGAVLMAVNFLVLRRITAFVLSGPPKKVAAATTLLILKLALFFVAVWGAMTYLPMNTLAFGLGAGVILLAVTLTTTLSQGAGADA